MGGNGKLTCTGVAPGRFDHTRPERSLNNIRSPIQVTSQGSCSPATTLVTVVRGAATAGTEIEAVGTSRAAVDRTARNRRRKRDTETRFDERGTCRDSSRMGLRSPCTARICYALAAAATSSIIDRATRSDPTSFSLDPSFDRFGFITKYH